MSQVEVNRILNENYPTYLSYKDIMSKLNINKSSVLYSLRAMRKRDEIEYKVMIGRKKKGGWITLYRAKGGNSNGK